MPRSIWTIVFWKDAADRALAAGAASATSAWTLGWAGVIPSVPGRAVLAALGAGAALDLLRSLASLRIDNGTASPLPEIVAAPKTERGTGL